MARQITPKGTLLSTVGLPGATGATGATGSTGSTGATGATGPAWSPDAGMLIYAYSQPSDSKWQVCEGNALNRTTKATLFALISTTFGVGDGSTTFNVPDYRGRMPIAAGTGSGLTARSLGGTGGVETVTLTAAQSGLPSHSHTVGTTSSGSPSNGAGASSASGTPDTSCNTSSAGGSSAGSSHDNMSPWLCAGKWYIYTG